MPEGGGKGLGGKVCITIALFNIKKSSRTRFLGPGFKRERGRQ